MKKNIKDDTKTDEKTDEKTEEKVVLTRKEFNEIQKDIQLLKNSVSRYKLEEQEAKISKNKDKLPRGHCKRLNGKLVVKWLGVNDPGSKAEQKILYQGTTPVGEVLVGHYKTIDDEDIVCEAIKFYRSTDLEYFTKIGQEGEDWIIRFDNPELPQEYKLNIKYLNP